MPPWRECECRGSLPWLERMIKRYGASSLQTKNALPLYLAPHFEETGEVVHAFSTRQGGVSPPPFDSLNLGLKAGDDETHVRENRRIFAKALGLDPATLLTASQVHGNNILVLESPDPRGFSESSCDAIVTDVPGILIGVLTADCVPILLFDSRHRAVAAVHVGWKGTALGLVEKTVATMIDQYDTDPREVLAAVGPSIGADCYEVDGRVRAAFSSYGGRWSRWARRISGKGWILNLAGANVDLLVGSGVPREKIVLFDICTHCEKDLFYSYRAESGRTGRQIASIMVRP